MNPPDPERLRRIYPLPARYGAHPDLGMERFLDTYDTVFYRAIPTVSDGRRPESLAQGAPMFCAYCARGKPEVSFAEDKHVVPVGLGNRTLFTSEECDGCNHAFERCDSALCELFLPVRALLGIQKRDGPLPKFKPSDRASIGGGTRGDPIPVVIDIEGTRIRLEDLGDHRARLVIDEFGVDVHSAMRSLARMAWIVSPEAVRKNSPELLTWVHADAPSTPYKFATISIPRGFADIHVTVWRRVDSAPSDAPRTVVQLIVGALGVMWFEPNFAGAPQSILWPALPMGPGASDFPDVKLHTVKSAGRTKMRNFSMDLVFAGVTAEGETESKSRVSDLGKKPEGTGTSEK